jgi:small subunit ribosomal protein S13
MAVRIAGIILPNTKRIEHGLTAIYGVGLTTARKVVAAAKVDPETRVKDLTEAEVAALRQLTEKQMRVEGDLRREVLLNIKRLKEIGSYRGTRHSRRLTVRGQRTKTNSRTVRGNVRNTMGSGRRSVDKK